jgi:aminoglycoside phosphotransferase (APT) family kinase protein
MAKAKQQVGNEMAEARAMARRIIEHHFGTKPKRIEHQGSGLSNFVFLIHHTEGDFVIRISPDATRINAFIKEQWAVGKAREVGVPTAEILEVGNSVIPYPYMVVRRVEGSDATVHPERLAILREMGRYASLINSIATTGFGGVFDWSSNQLSHNPTWKEYLHGELRLDMRLEILRKQRMLNPTRLKTLRTLLERAARRSAKTALNHGDIRLKNVIVNEAGKITAFIDWEDCVSHLTPHWELSLALHDLSIDEKQEFLTGYGLSAKQFAEIAPVVKALNIINYAPQIEGMSERNDRAQLEQLRTRLSGALDLYSM